MKANTHPHYHEVDVKCSCGAAFKINSTYAKDSMQLEICSNCHPFYTGKQKMVDTAGRVDSFQKKFGSRFARRKSGPASKKDEDKKD